MTIKAWRSTKCAGARTQPSPRPRNGPTKSIASNDHQHDLYNTADECATEE